MEVLFFLYTMKAQLKLENGKEVGIEISDKDLENFTKKERRRPDDTRTYWCVSGNGRISRDNADGCDIDKQYFNMNNFFSTREEAEMHALRIEGLSVKNTAKEGEDFYIWSFRLGSACISFQWELGVLYPKFKTKKEAQEWGYRYAEAIKFLDK